MVTVSISVQGRLLNLDGQVVGINTLVAGQAESGVQAQGIGFAISISTAKPIADQLVATGRVAYPFTSEAAEAHCRGHPHGAAGALVSQMPERPWAARGPDIPPVGAGSTR